MLLRLLLVLTMSFRSLNVSSFTARSLAVYWMNECHAVLIKLISHSGKIGWKQLDTGKSKLAVSMFNHKPGGPLSRAPEGILAPKSVYFFLSFRKSTISASSNLASCCPPTSLNVV